MQSRSTFRVYVAGLGLALAAAACGSGSTQLTGPTAVKCQATVSGLPSTVPAAGTQVTANVSAARECTWTVNSETSWLQISPPSGQGEASLTVKVAQNDAATPRSGAIVLNGQRVNLAQEAAPCRFSLGSPSVSAGHAGGPVSVLVQTLAGCQWQAQLNGSPWIQAVRGSGTGSGSAQFDVAANPGPARSAIIIVAGIAWRVDQAAAPAAGTPTPPPPTTPTPPPTPPTPTPPTPTPPPTPPTDPVPPAPVPEEPIRLSGRVSGLSGACPNLTFTVERQTVFTDSSTKFTSGNCRHVTNGRYVRVDGLVREAGRVYAVTVEIGDDDDDDDDDD
ncbi:MAG TPA: BACON domain-containing carbohydrate-binding protein [Vicinamibacterales bacterium]|nr:BACON domain-containing carbohydrate-binding protein [Vicinamibacterales bacterium]